MTYGSHTAFDRLAIFSPIIFNASNLRPSAWSPDIPSSTR